MVLLSPIIPPVAYWEFEADLLILHHPTTISAKYQAMGTTPVASIRCQSRLFLRSVHCGSIRQTATIISMSVEHLRTGDRATVRFCFIKSPEYLRLGMKLVFREGRTKAIGSVSKLYPHVAPQSSSSRGRGRAQAAANALANALTTDSMQQNKRQEAGHDANRYGNKRTKPEKATADTQTTEPAEPDVDMNRNLS